VTNNQMHNKITKLALATNFIPHKNNGHFEFTD